MKKLVYASLLSSLLISGCSNEIEPKEIGASKQSRHVTEDDVKEKLQNYINIVGQETEKVNELTEDEPTKTSLKEVIDSARRMDEAGKEYMDYLKRVDEPKKYTGPSVSFYENATLMTKYVIEGAQIGLKYLEGKITEEQAEAESRTVHDMSNSQKSEDALIEFHKFGIDLSPLGIDSEKYDDYSEDEDDETEEDSSDEASSSRFPFISEDGTVDIRSVAFIEYYFHHPRTNNFGEIKTGMSKSEIEDIYGPSTDDGHDGHQGGGQRFGDITVFFDDDVAKFIVLNPSQMVSKEEAIKLYGKPTIDEDHMTFGPMYTYNSDPNNGFEIRMIFDGDGNIAAMHNEPEPKN